MQASCDKDLEWYKSVKETQASVEVTSYGQMDNIKSYGCYCIGEMRDVAMDNIHDVIRLSLIPLPGKKLLKTSYTLDELRDLESKIVLITGSRAENRAAVDQFLDVCVACVCVRMIFFALYVCAGMLLCVYFHRAFSLCYSHTHTLPSLSQTLHCVCRIAEVLIKLQQAGHVQYIGWTIEFYCQSLLVKVLQEQAKQMEVELERWNKEVVRARERFYELNYYTMRQLLVLRSELGRMKSEQALLLLTHGQVMALLESISSPITPRALAGIVQKAASELLEDSYEETDDSMALPSTPVERENPLDSLSLPALPPVSQLASGTQPAMGVVSSLPPVRLSQKDLSEKQKSHLTDICGSLGLCEMIALKAIEEVGDGDWNDICNWIKCYGEQYYEKLFRGAENLTGGDDAESEDVEQETEEESEESVDDLPPTESNHTQSKIINPRRTCEGYNSCVLCSDAASATSINKQDKACRVLCSRRSSWIFRTLIDTYSVPR